MTNFVSTKCAIDRRCYTNTHSQEMLLITEQQHLRPFHRLVWETEIDISVTDFSSIHEKSKYAHDAPSECHYPEVGFCPGRMLASTTNSFTYHSLFVTRSFLFISFPRCCLLSPATSYFTLVSPSIMNKIRQEPHLRATAIAMILSCNCACAQSESDMYPGTSCGLMPGFPDKLLF